MRIPLTRLLPWTLVLVFMLICGPHPGYGLDVFVSVASLTVKDVVPGVATPIPGGMLLTNPTDRWLKVRVSSAAMRFSRNYLGYEVIPPGVKIICEHEILLEPGQRLPVEIKVLLPDSDYYWGRRFCAAMAVEEPASSSIAQGSMIGLAISSRDRPLVEKFNPGLNNWNVSPLEVPSEMDSLSGARVRVRADMLLPLKLSVTHPRGVVLRHEPFLPTDSLGDTILVEIGLPLEIGVFPSGSAEDRTGRIEFWRNPNDLRFVEISESAGLAGEKKVISP